MAGKITVSTINDSSGVLATQNGMTGIAKAWCQFTNSSGTLTINSSFNVSSLTYVSTGLITVNFTTSMPNANYALVGSSGTTGTTAGVLTIKRSTTTTSSTSFETVALNTSLTNMTENDLVIFSS